MNDNWVDAFDNSPGVDGWYAVLYCWDSHEGVHVGADYWVGYAWGENLPVTSFYGPFESREAADKYAWENDPDRLWLLSIKNSAEHE